MRAPQLRYHAPIHFSPPIAHLNRSGFSLMELMVVIAIIAILAMVAMPSYLFKRQQDEIAKAYRHAETVRDDITEYYYATLSFPADNDEGGLPEPDQLIGNRVTRMEVEDGAIHITLGNKVATSLQDKTLSLRPAIVTGSPGSPISWLCGREEPVAGMEAVGEDRTDVNEGLLPASCDN